MAGLVGAGRTELARAIFGMTGRSAADPARRPAARDPVAARGDRARHLPGAGGPQAVGLILEASISEQHLAAEPRPFAVAYRLDAVAERSEPRGRAGRLDIRTRLGHKLVGTLSGGNQQKVVLAKWLARRPRC